MIWTLLGCMTMDSFFFAPVALESYDLPLVDVPEDQVELVSFAAADGTELSGVWAWQDLPDDAQTLVVFHGNRDHIPFHWERVELYWSWGYNVFIFDYRGYGTSQGTPTHDGLLLDAQAAVEFVADARGVGTTELLYEGTSLGGYASVSISDSHPPGALVTEDLFSSAEALIETNDGINVPASWMFEGEWDTRAQAAELQDVPWLLLHGSDDAYIVADHARWLFEAANDPKDLWIVPGGTHGPADDGPRHYDVQPDEYERRLTGWWSPAPDEEEDQE